MHIIVESAIALSAKQKETLEDKVTKQLKQECEFSYSTDVNLIAGLRLVLPNKVVDQTVSARLAMLEDQLVQ